MERTWKLAAMAFALLPFFVTVAPGLQGGFDDTELTFGAGNEGAVSAVVLHLKKGTTLPEKTPRAVVDVARFLLSMMVATDFGGGLSTLKYVDGLTGSGQPVDNKITQDGNSKIPERCEIGIEVTPTAAARCRPTTRSSSSTTSSPAVPHPRRRSPAAASLRAEWTLPSVRRDRRSARRLSILKHGQAYADPRGRENSPSEVTGMPVLPIGPS